MRTQFILIATLFAFTARAQTNVYHPFPDSNATWHEEGAYWTSVWDIRHFRNEYYINGDTTIGAFVYQKIYLKQIEEFPSFIHLCWQFTAPVYDGYFAAIREDTFNKKVFVSGCNDSLLYDFDLSLNDTLSQGCFVQGIITVIKIDSIFISGNFRKRFFLSTIMGTDTVSLIEGIGSTRGLFFPLYYLLEGQNVLHCFEQNASVIYNDSCLHGCDLISNISSSAEISSTTTITPNPFHSSFLLEVSSEFLNAKVKMYNSLGSLVREEILQNQKSLLFYRNELHNGFYLLQLINDQGQTSVEKLVLE